MDLVTDCHTLLRSYSAHFLSCPRPLLNTKKKLAPYDPIYKALHLSKQKAGDKTTGLERAFITAIALLQVYDHLVFIKFTILKAALLNSLVKSLVAGELVPF